MAGWRGQESPDKSGLKRSGRELHSRVSCTPGSFPNHLRNSQEAQCKGLDSDTLHPSGSSDGTARELVGTGWHASCKSLGAWGSTLCPGLCHFPFFFFSPWDPAIRLWTGYSGHPVPFSVLPGCGPKPWRRAPAHPPSLPLPRFPSPLPPPGRGEAQERGAGGARAPRGHAPAAGFF